MVNLDKRATDAELMDDFNLTYSDVIPVLQGLEQINAIFGGHKILINALKSIPVKNRDAISDWGCGGGDSLRAIAKWARKHKLQLQLTGIDASIPTIAFASEKALLFENIKFVLNDVKADEISGNQYDIVYSSLFTHHFNNAEWVALVKKMLHCSKTAVIITDLHRHWLLYYSVIAITRMITKNEMARFDGPLSVRKGFKRSELINLLKKGHIINYKIRWKWIFKWQIIIYK